ncbi:MAG: hypothetical protein KC456_10225 [Flavobacteriales bacterium]|nr:hypothetical protein [Flavobacteriales bacterium]
MSDINNIDDLFKSKLAGREVGYSASAWASASALLDSHFRWLFFKKLFLFGIPFLFIFTSAMLYWIGGEQTLRTAGHEIVSTEFGFAASQDRVPADMEIAKNAASFVTGNTVNAALTSPNARPIEQPHESSDKPDITVGTQAKIESSYLKTGSDLENVSTPDDSAPIMGATTQPKMHAVAAPKPDLEPDPTPRAADIAHIEASPSREKASAEYHSEMMSTEMASLILKSNLDMMDIVSINRNSSELSELGPSLTPEPVKLSPNKLQVFAEGGLLIARGYHDLNVERLGPGLGVHARVLAKYHLGQSVYLDFGAGFLNRSSITKNHDFTGMQPGSLIEVSPIAANYASVLIGTGYRIGLRHSVGGGFELNPFINIVAKENVTINGETSKSAIITEKTGMAGIDAAFVLNHRMALKERLDVCTELHFGIFDATDNAVFNTGDISDYNTAIKIGLSYRLTKR